MKKRTRRWLLPVGRYALYGLCCLFSIFLLASGYESIYNRPLPFVHTLAKVNLHVLSQTYDLRSAAVIQPSAYGQFGKPATLTVPNIQSSQRLSIVAPINTDGIWLARASTMHMLVPNKPLNGNISTLILYCRASFRTISATTLPKVGGNLFIDTDQGWRYVYKVTLANVYTETYPYIPTDNGGKGKLIMFCNDSVNAANDAVEGDLISVQAVTQ